MLRELKNELKSRGYNAELTTQQKVNTELKGLVVHKGDANIRPIFYEETFANLTLKEAIEFVIDALESQPKFNTEIKDENIIPCLVNKEKNKKLLDKYPHVLWNDLAIIFRNIAGVNADGSMYSFCIPKGHKSAEELYDIALKNINGKFRTIGETLIDSLEEDDPMAEFIRATDDGRILVYQTPSKMWGACGLLDIDKLKEVADKFKSDLYLIPSSVHDIIARPVEDVGSSKELAIMVEEVNNSPELDDSEVLSYSVYRYDRDTNKVTIAYKGDE